MRSTLVDRPASRGGGVSAEKPLAICLWAASAAGRIRRRGPAEADEFQYAVAHLVATSRELALGGEGFVRPLEIDQKVAAFADEMIVVRKVGVESRRSSPGPRAQAPLRDEKLQISIDGPEGHPRHRPADPLVHPLRSGMRFRRGDGLEHEGTLAGLATGNRRRRSKGRSHYQ